MKQSIAKQSVGVWLDNTKAIIISKNADAADVDFTIQNTLKAKSGHGTGNEHTMHNAKQSDQLKYFKSLSALLVSYDDILLFGPGQVQEQLLHHLQQDQQFNGKKITLETGEQASDGQMIATVRKFFSN